MADLIHENMMRNITKKSHTRAAKEKAEKRESKSSTEEREFHSVFLLLFSFN